MYTNSIPNYPAIKAMNPLFPMVVHPTSIALLVYPTILYTRCISLLVYPTAYATLLHPAEELSSVFPMAMYPRLTSLIFSFVCVAKNYVRYWYTQLPCTQGSKLVPNGFAPKIQDQYHCWHTQCLCGQDPRKFFEKSEMGQGPLSELNLFSLAWVCTVKQRKNLVIVTFWQS